jgi:ferredoxin
VAYVIAEPCIGVKDRACVEVCPVDCIHPKADEDKGKQMLYIHPDECIDCGACEPVCPVKAISPEDEVPEKWKQYIEMNGDYYRLSADQFQEKWGQAP